MTTAHSHKEKVKDDLPLRPSDPRTNVDAWKNFLHGLLKKQIVNVVSGTPCDFDDELTRFIDNVWHDGYDVGLAHMDKMHHKIDKQLTNG